MEEQKRLKVGSYTPETEETEAIIDRDYYRQGGIFKVLCAGAVRRGVYPSSVP